MAGVTASAAGFGEAKEKAGASPAVLAAAPNVKGDAEEMEVEREVGAAAADPEPSD